MTYRFHMEFAYPAKIEKDEGGSWLVTFRDLPYGATEGNTMDEAAAEAVDCLEEVIAGCITDQKEIPTPSDPEPGEHLIRMSARMAAKTALYIAIRTRGIKNVELARRLQVDEKEVRRMLSPRHQTKLPRIEEALEKLGYQLTVSMIDSDAA